MLQISAAFMDAARQQHGGLSDIKNLFADSVAESEAVGTGGA